MQFWGQSFACNAFGKVLCQASEGKEEVLIQPINYSQSDAYRIHWPFLRDRRIDSYHPIIKQFLEDESELKADRHSVDADQIPSNVSSHVYSFDHVNTSGVNVTEMGYRFPGEFETHEATWLSWPHNPNMAGNVGPDYSQLCGIRGSYP